jgi:ribose 5-phosphate isomerase A
MTDLPAAHRAADPLLAAKRQAAERAAALVQPGMVVGLGTGSTAELAVSALARRLRAGEVKDIVGIPTSRGTEEFARLLDVPLGTLEQHPVVHLTIDGADEVDPQGNLIKGHGGALLWEKIVAAATERYVIAVDGSKLVQRLGTRCAVPVEVVPFGWNTHLATVRTLGGEPSIRTVRGSEPYRTDGDHYILDCRFPGGITDPARVDAALRTRPGIVETGLFLNMSPEVIVGRGPEG